MGGFWQMMYLAALVLILGWLGLELLGLVMMGGLALWPVLVAVAHDGRTYLVLALAMVASAFLWAWPARAAQQFQAQVQAKARAITAPLDGYCHACGSERPGLICPQCGAAAI